MQVGNDIASQGTFDSRVIKVHKQVHGRQNWYCQYVPSPIQHNLIHQKYLLKRIKFLVPV